MYNLTLKKLIIVSLCLYIAYYCSSFINASSKENFGIFQNKWYSNDCNEIGFIDNKNHLPVNYSIDDDCQLPTGSLNGLKEIILNSFQAWCKPLDIRFTILDDYQQEAVISVKIISRKSFLNKNLNDPANRNDNFNRKSVIGLVNRDLFEYVGVAKCENKDIDVYEIKKSTIFIIWDDEKNSEYKTSSYKYSEWLKLFTHEVGHSLGYRGHNENPINIPIMYSDGAELMNWEIDSPNIEDIEHLKNIYKSAYYLKNYN